MDYWDSSGVHTQTHTHSVGSMAFAGTMGGEITELSPFIMLQNKRGYMAA